MIFEQPNYEIRSLLIIALSFRPTILHHSTSNLQSKPLQIVPDSTEKGPSLTPASTTWGRGLLLSVFNKSKNQSLSFAINIVNMAAYKTKILSD